MRPSPEDIVQAGVLWDFMFFRTELFKADVIIGLGCHELSVADDVATLYTQGVAPVVLFTGNVGRTTEGLFDRPEAWMLKQRAVGLGIPKDVILTEEVSTNTGENMIFSQRLLAENGIDATRVVFVHPPYMLRRDYATFKKQWAGAERTEAGFWADEVDFNTYLTSSKHDAAETIAIIVGDVQRLEEYPDRGYEIPQTIPAEVEHAFKHLVRRGYTAHLMIA